MNESVDGERGQSAIASTRVSWVKPHHKVIVITAGMIGVIAFMMWRDAANKKVDEPPPPPNGVGQSVTYDPPKPNPMPVSDLPPPPPPAPRPQTPPPVPPLAPIPQTNQGQLPAVAPVAKKKERIPRLLSYESGKIEPPSGGSHNGEAGSSASGTQVVYKGTQIVGAQAGPAIDKTYVLMPGTIRCILDVAIDSTLPGPLICHLPAPVISDAGVTLMEKDSQIIGSYSSEVKQGQGRMLSVSATGYTTNGVPVPLGGPFADGLGRTGLDGNVNNRLMERFGGAALLFLTQSAFGVAQAALSKEGSGGNSYISFSQGNGMESLANEALRNTINIPPKITKNQGEEVSIWVLTPISFAAAYRLIPH